MSGAIRYIKFSGDYEKFYYWKENNKSIARHKGIPKYLTKQWYTATEEDAETDEDKIKIYGGKSKAWNFPIISLIYIPFGLIRKCDGNSH